MTIYPVVVGRGPLDMVLETVWRVPCFECLDLFVVQGMRCTKLIECVDQHRHLVEYLQSNTFVYFGVTVMSNCRAPLLVSGLQAGLVTQPLVLNKMQTCSDSQHQDRRLKEGPSLHTKWLYASTAAVMT